MNILVVFASHWQWLSLGTYCPLSSFDTAGIQDSFRKVVAASQTVDTIRNKLTVLRDAEESHEVTLVKDEDVDCKLDLEIEASKDSDALK